MKQSSDWPAAKAGDRASIIEAGTRRYGVFQECLIRQHALVDWHLEQAEKE